MALEKAKINLIFVMEYGLLEFDNNKCIMKAPIIK